MAVQPLTSTEQTRLEMLEEIVQSGIDTIFDIAEALAAIKEERLYREGNRTWEQYCQERWGITRQRAGQLLRWVATVAELEKEMETAVSINEAQSRELRGLEPAEKAAIVEQVAGSGEVTAPRIKSAVDQLREAKTAKEKIAIIQEEEDAALREEERGFGRAMLRQLQRAHQAGQKAGGPFDEVMDLIRQLARSICDVANLDLPKWAQEDEPATKRSKIAQ